MIYKTPDLDALVLDALRATDLTATVAVLMPQEPSAELPLIVARQVPGGTSNAMGMVTGIVDVQSLAATRRAASELSRDVQAALHSACRSRFLGTDGYLCRFEPVTGAPVEIRVGVPTPDTNLFRFQATYRITARASL